MGRWDMTTSHDKERKDTFPLPVVFPQICIDLRASPNAFGNAICEMLENPEGCYFKLKKHSLVICLRKVGILQAPSLCLLFDSNSQKDRCMIRKHMGSNAGWIKHTRFLVSQDISSDLFLTIKVQRTGRFQPISTDFSRWKLISIFPGISRFSVQDRLGCGAQTRQLRASEKSRFLAFFALFVVRSRKSTMTPRLLATERPEGVQQQPIKAVTQCRTNCRNKVLTSFLVLSIWLSC